ncbi:MAG: hypothetical protein CMO01_30710 [Thalassobius sp.]|nr:hypothetical protein [Thalassovita sp.]
MNAKHLIIISLLIFSCSSSDLKKDDTKESSLNTHVEVEKEFTKYDSLPKLDSVKKKALISIDTIDLTIAEGVGNASNGITNTVETLGIGLLIASDTFSVYGDSILNNLLEEIRIYEWQRSDVIIPFISKSDYGIIHFICLAETVNYYKVLNSYNQVLFLRKDQGNIFKTWEAYMKESLGVYPKKLENYSYPNRDILKFKNSIDEEEFIYASNYEYAFCVLEVKGDWIKIQYFCNGNDCNETNCSEKQTAWMKWKENTKLLIDILLLS